MQRSVRRVEGEWLYFDPKTEQGRRKIALTALALEALRQHRVRQAAERLAVGPAWQENGLVFTDEIGQQLRDTTVYTNRFLPICCRSGLPLIRFHDLRHTAATLLLLLGIHPKVVSEMLGHSTVQITMNLYSHVLPDMQHQATDALNQLLDT